jgi:hypothetical protein
MKTLAAAALLLISGCAALSDGMTVRAEPRQYSPAMSSTVGIGLTTFFTPPAGVKVNYHWSANFGYFVSWRGPDNKVVPMGTDLIATEGTLYWTYDPKLTIVSKPEVIIHIEAQNAENDRVLARTKVNLEWERDIAQVSD